MSDTMPPVDQDDIEWAYYLWNSLSIGKGRWVLPGVGAYLRTGDKELTLTEIHFDRPFVDELGSSVFNKHHWIMVLADNINWTIKEEVIIAFDGEEELLIPDKLIGHVSVCAERCGAVFRVEAAEPSGVYVKISDGLECPCCGKALAIEPDLKGVHVVVDDKGYLLKQERIQEEE